MQVSPWWQPWWEQARCAKLGYPTEWFFPEHSSADRGKVLHGHLTPTEKKAKACCIQCPVRQECLEAGLDEKLGIWGGTLHRERVKMEHLPRKERVRMLLERMDRQSKERRLED